MEDANASHTFYVFYNLENKNKLKRKNSGL